MDFSLDQERIDYEINSNPELQKTEVNPSVAREVCVHDKVYKTLVTLGDFICYVWFHDDDYDDSRTTEGSKRIHIVPSESRIEDEIKTNEYLNIASNVFTDGVIYVNAIFRRNGTAFNENKDLKDCVKYMSGVAAHYNASSDKIVAIDIEDNDRMYDMTYDVSSSKTYSDVSNNVLSDFTSGAVGNGSLDVSNTTHFASGAIALSAVNSAFTSGTSIGAYYRGTGVGNITANNNVPTSGAISFSDLRNAVSKVTATANGNWMHLQARYEVFGDNTYTSTVTKQLNIGGNVGSDGSGNPAVRFNSGGNGSITFQINNTSGSPVVRGYAGETGIGGGNTGDGGGGKGDGGENGGQGMIVASTISMPTSHYNNRLRGGGGGGGGGGKGGTGGGGGHSGGRRCSGWFCHGSYRVCSNNGGTGGAGGNGGGGGRGAGYYWNGSSWVAKNSGDGGQGGVAGSGGGTNAGTGGTGGNGGGGGNYESNGGDGAGGNTGANGGGEQQGCGSNGSQGGSGGAAGGGKGSGASRHSTSGGANLNLT
tara:strand:+ start:5285 stop:6889 length:1605 start_codon:yes stop_codon:yes gene_type:complete